MSRSPSPTAPDHRAGAGLTLAALGLLALVTAAPNALGHCQVPCGIYDDAARIAQMREDATTIDKAVAKINELSLQRDATAFNQAARWVTTKEEHASRIIETTSTYFLTQKLKPPRGTSREETDAYHRKLAAHHHLMRAAMRAKQTVDPAVVAELRDAIDAVAAHWTPADSVRPAPATHSHEPQTRRRRR